MATRSELRTTVRIRLEDATPVALFADDDLNELLAQALAEYGRVVPLPSLATATVAAGVTTIPLPVSVLDAGLVAIQDATGAEIPPMVARFGRTPQELIYRQQAWRVWAGVVRLQRPVTAPEAGSWALEHLAPRLLPATDGDPVPIEPGDEPLVVELTIARLYQRRAFEDTKRGADGAGSNALAAAARETAAAMLQQRNRRARGGFFDQVA